MPFLTNREPIVVLRVKLVLNFVFYETKNIVMILEVWYDRFNLMKYIAKHVDFGRSCSHSV